jgi:hypothetical protein
MLHTAISLQIKCISWYSICINTRSPKLGHSCILKTLKNLTIHNLEMVIVIVTIMDLWTANYVFPFIRFDPDSLPTHSDCHEVTYDDWSTHLRLLTAWLIRLLMPCHTYWYYQAWVSILTVRLVILLTLLTDPLAMTHAPMGCTYI